MSDDSRTVREQELRWSSGGRGADFGFRRKALGAAAGGRKLGCGLYEVPPGRRAWPFHSHLANEEAIYVLEGTGKLRLEDAEVPLSPGTYAAFPVGVAHAVRNDSDRPLRYLCFSTMIEPDVTLYPDSDKVGLIAGSAPGGPKEDCTLALFLRRSAEVGYWEGEG